MGSAVSWEQEVQKILDESPALERVAPHKIWARACPWVPRASPGDSHDDDSTAWLGPRASFGPFAQAALPKAGPLPWATWVPAGDHRGTGHLSNRPSIWCRNATLVPCLGDPCFCGYASSEFLPFGGPAAPLFPARNTRGGLQECWDTAAKSSCDPASRGPAREAPHLKRSKAPPPRKSGFFNIWAPRPSSPELCPLPPSPEGDPQPCPRGPQQPPRRPPKARRCLFESFSNCLSVQHPEPAPGSASKEVQRIPDAH